MEALKTAENKPAQTAGEPSAKKPVAKKVAKLNIPTKARREQDKAKYRKISDADKTKIGNMLKSGMTIWETTEKFFGMKLEHARKYKDITWWYYQKVNAVRHELNLDAKKPAAKNPETVYAFNTAVAKLGEAKFRELVAKAVEGVKTPS